MDCDFDFEIHGCTKTKRDAIVLFALSLETESGGH